MSIIEEDAKKRFLPMMYADTLKLNKTLLNTALFIAFCWNNCSILSNNWQPKGVLLRFMPMIFASSPRLDCLLNGPGS